MLHSVENRFKLFDYQLILKRKTYEFNEKTLQYEIKTVPFKIFVTRIFRFFFVTTALASVLSLIFYLFLGSPIEQALQLKVTKIKSDFNELNGQILATQNKLHSNFFPTDKYYRELLELDSLSTPERLGGIGGSEKPIDLEAYPTNLIINSASKQIKALKKQVELQDNSYQQIFKEAIIYNSELVDIPAIQPIKPDKSIWISSYFGYRTDPFNRIRRRHKGIDFVGPKNTEIYATADGIIKLSKESRRGYGKEIIISHKFGYSTRYAHLNKILVEEGQKVRRGELIGLMGSTGRSTGTHLHYEVRLNKKQVNPYFFFADDLTTEEYEQITALSLAGNTQ